MRSPPFKKLRQYKCHRISAAFQNVAVIHSTRPVVMCFNDYHQPKNVTLIHLVREIPDRDVFSALILVLALGKCLWKGPF